MDHIYQINRYGISVSYSGDITKYEYIKFGAPTPSCFVYKQVNAQFY